MRLLRPNEKPDIKTPKMANREIYDFLATLRPGDKAILERGEWRGKTPFEHAVHSVKSLKHKFSISALKDGGWLVERRPDLQGNDAVAYPQGE